MNFIIDEALDNQINQEKTNKKQAPSFRKWETEINGKTIRFDSRYERNFAYYLEVLKEYKQILWWVKNTTKFPFSQSVFVEKSNMTLKSFVPDFLVFLPNGKIQYVEVKWWQIDKFIAQEKQFRKDYPFIDLSIMDKEKMLKIQKKYVKRPDPRIPWWELIR